jgi:hypothetical protein
MAKVTSKFGIFRRFNIVFLRRFGPSLTFNRHNTVVLIGLANYSCGEHIKMQSQGMGATTISFALSLTKVCSADFIHHPIQGLMVVTGCIDFNVKLWSHEGEELGIFGLDSWNVNNHLTWYSTVNSSDYALKVFQNLEEEASKLQNHLAKEKEVLDRAKKPGFGGWDICSSEDGLPLRTHKAADKEVSNVLKKCFSPKELTMANSRPIEILQHRRREKMVQVPPKRLPIQYLSPVIPPSRSQSSMSFLSPSSSPAPGASAPSPGPAKAKR